MRTDAHLVRSEQIDLIVIVSSGRGSSGSRGGAASTTKELGTSLLVTRKSGMLSLPRLDVLVPTRDVWVLCSRWCGLHGCVDTDIGLRRSVSLSREVIDRCGAMGWKDQDYQQNASRKTPAKKGCKGRLIRGLGNLMSPKNLRGVLSLCLGNTDQSIDSSHREMEGTGINADQTRTLLTLQCRSG